MDWLSRWHYVGQDHNHEADGRSHSKRAHEQCHPERDPGFLGHGTCTVKLVDSGWNEYLCLVLPIDVVSNRANGGEWPPSSKRVGDTKRCARVCANLEQR